MERRAGETVRARRRLDRGPAGAVVRLGPPLRPARALRPAAALRRTVCRSTLCRRGRLHGQRGRAIARLAGGAGRLRSRGRDHRRRPRRGPRRARRRDPRHPALRSHHPGAAAHPHAGPDRGGAAPAARRAGRSRAHPEGAPRDRNARRRGLAAAGPPGEEAKSVADRTLYSRASRATCETAGRRSSPWSAVR